MGKTKRDFINDLIETAQCNVWKSELVIKFRQENPSEDPKKDSVDIKASEHAIKKDLEYIDFLKKELPDNGVSSSDSL